MSLTFIQNYVFIDGNYLTLVRMALGKRRRQAKQVSMWVATQDLPLSAAHPFYTRLNQILDQHDFDRFVEGLCERFYADEGRPGLPPGRLRRSEDGGWVPVQPRKLHVDGPIAPSTGILDARIADSSRAGVT
jgi:hypothetical protein